MTGTSITSELVRIDRIMQERKKILLLPVAGGLPPMWMLLDDLVDVDVDRLRQEIVEVLAENLCRPTHIPGILTLIRESVAAIDGTWVHDILPTITQGVSKDIRDRVERAVLDISGSFHVALKRWLALSGRDRLYLEQGTYHWYVRAVAGETAKIPESLAFLRGCLEFALKQAGSGDAPYALALDAVDREWRRILEMVSVNDQPELLRAALDGQRQSVCEQCTFAVELFRHLSSLRLAPIADGLDETLNTACVTLGIESRHLLRQTRHSILAALDLPSLRVSRGTSGHRQSRAVGKYLLMDCSYCISSDDHEIMARLFGFSLSTAVEGHANCRLVLDTNVGDASQNQETLWSGIVAGQVQVRFDRIMKHRLGSSGVAIVRLLQDDSVELCHQTLRFPNPSLFLNSRILSPGRWVLPSGNQSITLIADQEPHVTGCGLRLIRAPDKGVSGVWSLIRMSDAGLMLFRLRGPPGLREWRLDRMTMDCAVGLSVIRGEGASVYTDDDYRTPVIDGANARLRLTVAGKDGPISNEAMMGILDRIEIGWQCDAIEGRTGSNGWARGDVVRDGELNHLDIPFEAVAPRAVDGRWNIHHWVFQVMGFAGSTDSKTIDDTSSSGDRFEVLELPHGNIRAIPRRPGVPGALEFIDQTGNIIFRLEEDKTVNTTGRPTTDVVPLHGRLNSLNIPLLTMMALPSIGVWPYLQSWGAPTLLQHLQDERCAIALGLRGRSIRVRITETEMSGHPLIDEQLNLGPEVDGAVSFADLLPSDMVERQVWNRLLGNGWFDVEYGSDVGPIGRFCVDARSRPMSMAVVSNNTAAMTMNIQIDGHSGSPRSVICRTLDGDGRHLDSVKTTFGNDGPAETWLTSGLVTISRTLTIRIRRNTAKATLVEALSGAELLAIPVTPVVPDTVTDIPAPPWSIEELGVVIGVVRRSPAPWSDQQFRLVVAVAIEKTHNVGVKAFLHVLQAWLLEQPKAVETVDPENLPPSQLDAAMTMWLDLAMGLQIPPDPGTWEQTLRVADTSHAARLLHVFESLRKGSDIPWKHGQLVDPPCRIRNNRLAKIAGFLEHQ